MKIFEQSSILKKICQIAFRKCSHIQRTVQAQLGEGCEILRFLDRGYDRSDIHYFQKYFLFVDFQKVQMMLSMVFSAVSSNGSEVCQEYDVSHYGECKLCDDLSLLFRILFLIEMKKNGSNGRTLVLFMQLELCDTDLKKWILPLMNVPNPRRDSRNVKSID